MTVVALLSVAPVIEDSMAGEVAKAVEALDEFDVSYRISRRKPTSSAME